MQLHNKTLNEWTVAQLIPDATGLKKADRGLNRAVKKSVFQVGEQDEIIHKDSLGAIKLK